MRSLTLAALLSLACLCRADKGPPVLDVWPDGKPPGVAELKGEEKAVTSGKVTRVSNVVRPTLTVYRPAKDKDTGACVVVCPGGGYNILAWDLEGTEVAAWLNGLGVTAVVLKYRVPRPPGLAKGEQPIGPLQDAQRAVSLVRSKAKEWGVDPKRVGILGFSAGGHLAASTSLKSAKRSYPAIDAVDEVSCRPDFTVLIYPAYLVTNKRDALRPEFVVDRTAPPMFLAHAGNDGVPSENSVLLHLALKKAEVPSDLHIYSTGGHGFGLRPSKDPCSTWPARCGEWMQRQGLLKRGE